MPNVSAYVRRWTDEVTGEPVIEVRIEGAHDAPAEAMAAAAHAAARVAVVEFSSRRRSGEPPANDSDFPGGATDPTAPRPSAPRDSAFATLRDEFQKEGHTSSDWEELLAQRAREIKAFRDASIRFPDMARGARLPALYPGELQPTVFRPEFLNAGRDELESIADRYRARVKEQNLSDIRSEIDRALSGGLARVIKDADIQYVVDALIHAGTALSSLHGLTAIEWPDDRREARFEIDNSRQSALINSALARLGVNPLSDLPMREIHPDSDPPREAGSTDPSGEKR